MDKKTKLSIGVIIVAVVACFWYICSLNDGFNLGLLRGFSMLLYAACQMLIPLVSKRHMEYLPEAVLEKVTQDEDYILAQNRVREGRKIMLCGGLIGGFPLIRLFMGYSVGGILFWCLIIGVIFFLIGAFMEKAGSEYRIEIPEEVLENMDVDFEEGLTYKGLNLIKWIALIAWILLFLFAR